MVKKYEKIYYILYYIIYITNYIILYIIYVYMEYIFYAIAKTIAHSNDLLICFCLTLPYS